MTARVTYEELVRLLKAIFLNHACSEHVATLPKDKHLLIHCHHGGRSLRVTQYLRAKGFTAVTNVAGGIDAWAQTFDPAMRRY